MVVERWHTVRGRLYGPYYARVWWEGGRQRKAYVRPADLEAVRRACEGWRERRGLTDKERRWLDREDDARDRAQARRAAEYAACHPSLANALAEIDRVYGSASGGR